MRKPIGTPESEHSSSQSSVSNDAEKTTEIRLNSVKSLKQNGSSGF